MRKRIVRFSIMAALDPFIELTIADRNGPALAACRVNTRQLAVLRLERLSQCTLVARR